MHEDGISAAQGQQLVAQISTRLIDQYGATAIDEALSVVSMLVELGREELVPVWLKAAIEIGRQLAGRGGRLGLH